MKWLLVVLFLCTGKSIVAEVEQIALTWNALTCLDICSSSIQVNLEKIPWTHRVQVNGNLGTAAMEWDPNYPLSYEPFRAAFAATGVLIRDMRVRVRGTVHHNVGNFYIISNGDNSRFLLIGPLEPEPGRYIPKYNLSSYPLLPRLREQLLIAEKNGFIVVITGPLFLPEKYPLTLITEQIKIEKPIKKVYD